MTRPLLATIVVVAAFALWLAVTLAGRVDDTVQLEPASTSTDRLPDGIGVYVARLHDRTPPTAPPATTTTAVKRKQTTPPWDDWTWDELAQCESGGNWSNDSYHDGALQFHPDTWLGYGGGEYAPYAWGATREQQIVVAERVLEAEGPGAWPVCSYRVGMR